MISDHIPHAEQYALRIAEPVFATLGVQSVQRYSNYALIIRICADMW